jgi:hypothetical protein
MFFCVAHCSVVIYGLGRPQAMLYAFASGAMWHGDICVYL